MRAILGVAIVIWVMWWVMEAPSRAQGRARALIVTIVALLINCAGGL
jgi:hypothetical protein